MTLVDMEQYSGPLPEAMVALGRGIDDEGNLSETSELRAKIAVDVALVLMPRVVVFSGGHSWVQERECADVPSEGAAMLARAMAWIDELGLTDDPRLAGVTWLAEGTSRSTAENLVNSKPMLGLSPGETLLILTDELHNSEGRVDDLGQLVFPDQNVYTYAVVPNTPLPGAEREEKLATYMTRAFMFRVQPGNGEAIMRRQGYLERANSWYRTAITGAQYPRRIAANLGWIMAGLRDRTPID